MAILTSAFQGVTTPLSDLYNEIHQRGWSVTGVNVKDHRYVAQASNPHGEKVERYGPDANTAVAQLLMFIMRREHIRQGAWSQHWGDKLEEIANSYAKAPHFDPKAAAAWKELADDCMARAHVLGQQVHVEFTHDPEPYHTPQDMFEDVQKKKHLLVSDAATQHPVWTHDQVLAFRICHDILGHAVAGGDWNWTGENLATAAHMPHLTPNAQRALFSETIGKAAYNSYYRGFGPQKICFLDDHLSPVQEDENPAAHGGEHPSMSLAPSALPSRSSGVERDPNEGYATNIVPPSGNAITLYGDPLDHMTVKDQAHALDTGWSQWTRPDGTPDLNRIKQAVMNAFRAALLSPLKELKWNAAHYQDISHIPHHETDPKVYWDALERARINHNRYQGFPDPEIRHKEHYESLLEFYRYYHQHHPEMSPSEAKQHAEREVQIMQAEIEEQLLNKSKDTDLEVIAPKVFKQLDKRLKLLVKDDKPLFTASAAPDNPYDPNREAYGAWIGRHLISIAQLAKYENLLTEAALEDVRNNDGAGHHFRATVLKLGIPYVGPKIVSYVWLLLQPLTSQLATIDTHMQGVLGHKDKSVSNRDYFGLERQLMAGRDSAGYSHMPLGQFQWAMWDHKRTGPGSHQDHSPLRVYEPQPWHQVDWPPKVPRVQKSKGAEWMPPEWWSITQPYRDSEAAAWAHDVAAHYPKNQIPWSEKPVTVPHMASEDGTADELHLALDVPEWVRKKIAMYVGLLSIAPSDIIDPADYHITVAYSENGANDPSIVQTANQFNLTGLKFVGKRLTKFGDALVIELDNSDFDDIAEMVNVALEEHGLTVSRFDGGFKPHITVAYTDDYTNKPLPLLSFRAGGLSASTPRKAKPIPSLWAKMVYASLLKLAAGWKCKNCSHEFGEDLPHMKHCPDCGVRLFDSKYNYNTGKDETQFDKPMNLVRDADPNQMSINTLMPTEVHVMPSAARGNFDGTYARRLTVGYDSINNRIYIGPTGSYHAHCGRHFNVPMEEGEYDADGKLNGAGWYVGYINLPTQTTESTDLHEAQEEGLLKGAVMGWYHRIPPNKAELDEAVGIGKAPEGGPQAKTEEEALADLNWDDDDDDVTPPAAPTPAAGGGKLVSDYYSHASELPSGMVINTGYLSYEVEQKDGTTYLIYKKDGVATNRYKWDDHIGQGWTIVSDPTQANNATQPSQDVPSQDVMQYWSQGATTTSQMKAGDIFCSEDFYPPVYKVLSHDGDIISILKPDGQTIEYSADSGTVPMLKLILKDENKEETNSEFANEQEQYKSMFKTWGDLPIGTVVDYKNSKMYKKINGDHIQEVEENLEDPDSDLIPKGTYPIKPEGALPWPFIKYITPPLVDNKIVDPTHWKSDTGKQLKDVKPGDKVWLHDDTTGKHMEHTVETTQMNEDGHTTQFKLPSGGWYDQHDGFVKYDNPNPELDLNFPEEGIPEEEESEHPIPVGSFVSVDDQHGDKEYWKVIDHKGPDGFTLDLQSVHTPVTGDIGMNNPHMKLVSNPSDLNWLNTEYDAHHGPLGLSVNYPVGDSAVFATTHHGNKYRVTPWTTWDKSQQHWNDADLRHSDQTKETGIVYGEPVRHYEVRSQADPNYNGLPQAQHFWNGPEGNGKVAPKQTHQFQAGDIVEHMADLGNPLTVEPPVGGVMVHVRDKHGNLYTYPAANLKASGGGQTFSSRRGFLSRIKSALVGTDSKESRTPQNAREAAFCTCQAGRTDLCPLHK